MNQDIALWKTWGEYFNYPSCCVEAFCKEEHVRKGVFWGSGFCPCTSCYDKVKDLSYEEAVTTLLKHDPKATDNPTVKGHYTQTIRRVNSDNFKRIALEKNLDISTYLGKFMKDVKEM